MRKNGINSSDKDLHKTDYSDFINAQNYVNFVVLFPKCLPENSHLKDFSVRRETNQTRSSIRFEVENGNRLLRVKQFFYDWSYPAFTDTNLVNRDKTFYVNEVIGYLGTDYKKNKALCHTRWFTQVEVSVLKGKFSDKELIHLAESLSPVSPSAIENVGKLSFAESSHSARFHLNRWSRVDEMAKANWKPGEGYLYKGINDCFIPPAQVNSFKTDSTGYFEKGNDFELHSLLRSTNNHTDLIWVYIYPESSANYSLLDLGRDWTLKEIIIKNREWESNVTLGRRSDFGGLRGHWNFNNITYNIIVKPTQQLFEDDLIKFIQHFQK